MNGITEEMAVTKCKSLEKDKLVIKCGNLLKITLVTQDVIRACVEDVKVSKCLSASKLSPGLLHPVGPTLEAVSLRE